MCHIMLMKLEWRCLLNVLDRFVGTKRIRLLLSTTFGQRNSCKVNWKPLENFKSLYKILKPETKPQDCKVGTPLPQLNYQAPIDLSPAPALQPVAYRV